MGLAARGVFVGVLAVAGCGFEHGHLGAPDGGPLPMDTSMVVGHTRLVDITDVRVIDGPHIDFPLLVALDESWLRDLAHGGDVQNSSGFDIGFSSDRDGTMRLAQELVHYASDTGELVAWVKLPALESSTTFYIHYGDPSIMASHDDAPAVWSGGYGGVWHFESDLVNVIGGVAATNGGTTEAAGKFGAARSFDGTDSYIDVAASTSVDDVFVGGGTAEAWCKATTYGESLRGRIFDKGGALTVGWLLSYDTYNVTGSALFATGASTTDGEWNTPASSLPLGEWVHVAVVYDSTSSTNVPQLFINGGLQTPAPNPTPSGSIGADTGLVLRIGNRSTLDRTFDGLIDEPRLSTGARSAGWIDTEVRNQTDPAGFLSVGSEL